MNKSNPVKKYQDYQKMWNRHKAPGEKKHSDLRWSIREQMLEKHVILKRPQKSFTQNTYVIPTEKKRQQLRWMVRSALANPF
jgi:hydrolethalus syndrome protein 1